MARNEERATVTKTGLPKAPPEKTSGPVPQHHRLATGEKTDGVTNPYGTGEISKKSTIAGKHGW